jgi:hypothetical protein
MIRILMVTAVLAACSKSAPPDTVDCELLRTKYIAFVEQNMKDLTSGSAHVSKAILEQGNHEVELGKERFVAVCKDLGTKIDPLCFEPEARTDRELKKRCHDLNKELLPLLYRE